MSDPRIRRTAPNGQKILDQAGRAIGVRVFNVMWLKTSCLICQQDFWTSKKFRNGPVCSKGCAHKRRNLEKYGAAVAKS